LEVGGALRLRLEAGDRGRRSEVREQRTERNQRSEIRRQKAEGNNCETGNPPEGWESEGQFRIADCGFKKA
jgi:hypothetical protein